jgi:hypothetical protein
MMKDLIALTSDKNMRFAIEGILSRPKALGMRTISFDIPADYLQNDPGLLNRGHEYLRNKIGLYEHALMILDRCGCGRENSNREELEEFVENNLRQTGWRDRAAAAIIIDPELENWVWSDSPHVARVLGWPEPIDALRSWLTEQGFTFTEDNKPVKPKETVECVIRYTQKRRSSDIYKEIAENISLTRCADPAFLKLRITLQSWFPIHNHP